MEGIITNQSILLIFISIIFVFFIASIARNRISRNKPAEKSPEEILLRRYDLENEIDEFRKNMRGKTTSQWSLAEHAHYASIRRREEELL